MIGRYAHAMNPAESSRPTVSGVYETVLYATNIPEVAAFYTGMLGLPLLRESSEQSAVFRGHEPAALVRHQILHRRQHRTASAKTVTQRYEIRRHEGAYQ